MSPLQVVSLGIIAFSLLILPVLWLYAPAFADWVVGRQADQPKTIPWLVALTAAWVIMFAPMTALASFGVMKL
jgi:hypothetical protein